MTTYRLKNIQDKSMNDLDKARSIVADKNTSLKKLGSLTKIPYQSLANYRADLSKLDRASWKRVNLLSQLFEAAEERGENIAK